MAAGAAGSAFTVGTSAAAVIAALVAMVAALAIVVELLPRQALIYAAVLFLPLSFAAMVWPRPWAWTQRLVEIVVIAALAKFLIVSVLVLGAAAFDSFQHLDTSLPPAGARFPGPQKNGKPASQAGFPDCVLGPPARHPTPRAPRTGRAGETRDQILAAAERAGVAVAVFLASTRRTRRWSTARSDQPLATVHRQDGAGEDAGAHRVQRGLADVLRAADAADGQAGGPRPRARPPRPR